ncbi:HIT domain-containing protein [Rhizoctonia solani AG-1 IA]|uniref:HIT domain-containing protein n=1 Tax=Thanatephorus cucumeris (strain AG1-IA) TaxID=983506 RepID=L8WG92_THACA|nr:HIT domain-containing protein [Rhizoctonia solani AG-1 IA]
MGAILSKHPLFRVGRSDQRCKSRVSMTSHMIDQFVHRTQNCNTPELDCIFCEIISARSPCYKIYETDQVVAILDIQPIRRGHALVMPKIHIEKVSDLPPELAGAVGTAVSRVAGAICRAITSFQRPIYQKTRVSMSRAHQKALQSSCENGCVEENLRIPKAVSCPNESNPGFDTCCRIHAFLGN